MSTISVLHIFPANSLDVNSELIEVTLNALKPEGLECSLSRQNFPDASWDEYLAEFSNEEEPTAGVVVYKEPEFSLFKCQISEASKHYQNGGLLTIDLARAKSILVRNLSQEASMFPAEVKRKFEINSSSLKFGFHDIFVPELEIEDARFIARPPLALEISGYGLPGKTFWSLFQKSPAMTVLREALEVCWGRVEMSLISY